MILKIFLSLLSSVLAFQTCIDGVPKGITQEPKHIFVNSGETAVISCKVSKQVDILGIYVRKRFMTIMYINKSNNLTVKSNYKDRLTCSGTVSNFRVILRNLTEEDTDLYLCNGAEVFGNGTLIVVRAPFDNATGNTQDKNPSNSSAHVPYIITAFILVILCVVSLVFLKYKSSKEQQSRNQNTYVDMTQTLRRNTMGNSSIYTKPQNTASSDTACHLVYNGV
ncbi:uncharacterized protein LOC142095024 [Mixophyes fleayi]|uniref:uncharacterized protein LOC142095024 n=1 Tax=Mixophyes fleayi TaxID=3061075 RepID=UPI003F4D898E